MKNLYLFRHVITGKVIVSPTFQLESKMLNQIGENRSSLKIRHDHWTPFSIVTGIQTEQIRASILRSLLPKIYSRPLGRYRLPLPPPTPTTARAIEAWKQPRYKLGRHEPANSRGVGDFADLWEGWKVPDAVKEKTLALCQALNGDAVKSELVSSSSRREDGAAAAAEGVAEVDSNVQAKYTIWWERDEYRRLVEGATVGKSTSALFWPSYVQHRRLELERGRIPVGIDGFKNDQSPFRQ